MKKKAEYYQIVDYSHSFPSFQIFCDHPHPSLHIPSPPPNPLPPSHRQVQRQPQQPQEHRRAQED